MKKILLIALLVIFTMVTTMFPVKTAVAGGPGDLRDVDIVADALVVRPISLASIVIGSVIFVAALPFSIPTRSVGIVGKAIVVDPCKYTFVRPMGDFNY